MKKYIFLFMILALSINVGATQIGTKQIKDGAITTAKLDDEAVNDTKLEAVLKARIPTTDEKADYDTASDKVLADSLIWADKYTKVATDLLLDDKLDIADSTIFIWHDGSVDFTADQSLAGFNITNSDEPSADSELATKYYVDNSGGGAGDMLKSTYDPDEDGKIAEAQLALYVGTIELWKAIQILAFRQNNFEYMIDGYNNPFDVEDEGIDTVLSDTYLYDAAGDYYYQEGVQAGATTEIDYMEYADDASAQAAYVSSDTTGGYTADKTPTMTSNTAPSGTASADSAWDASYAAWKAMDDNSTTYWHSDASMPVWLQYEFTSAKTIVKYTIQASVSDVYYPINFKFQGSNDGVNYTDCDTQVNQNFTTGEKKEYSFSNTTSYTYYRLYITSSSQGTHATIGELEMMELVTPNLQCYSEDTIKQQGSYSLKAIAVQTDSLNDTLTRTVDPTIDLSDKSSIKYHIYSADRTGSHIKIGIHDSGGTTTEHTANISSTGAWELQTWDVSAVTDANKDVIDSIIVTVVNADAANTFYLDNVFGQTAATGGGNMELYTSQNWTINLTPTIVRGLVFANKAPDVVKLSRTGTGVTLTDAVLNDTDTCSSGLYSFEYSADVSGEASDTCIRMFISEDDTDVFIYGVSLMGTL